MQPLTQEQAFLRAICEDPFDDTPRLIYADWLEENGRAERAEFIRVQVEWERDFAPVVQMAGAGSERWHQRRQYLVERLWVLEGSHPFRLRCLPDVWPWRRGFAEAVALPLDRFLREAKELFGSLPLLRVRLTDRIPLTLQHVGGDSWSCAWRATKDPLSEGVPLRLFQLLADGQPQAWITPGRSYATKQAALMDLSAACVAYGRQQASLPPLPAGA